MIQRLGIHRASRLAAIGSVIVLLTLSLVGFVGSLRTESLIERSRHANRTIAVLEGARSAMAAEHGVLDRYLQRRDAATRAAVEHAVGAVDGALARVQATGRLTTAEARRVGRWRERAVLDATRYVSTGPWRSAEHQNATLHRELALRAAALDAIERREVMGSEGSASSMEARSEQLLTFLPIAVLIALVLLVTLWALAREAERREATREAELAVREREALVDDLTGARNHRSLRLDLPQHLHRHARVGAPLALVMFDLDGLKQVNDVEGHQAGDRLLKAFVSLVNAAAREGDGLYRVGGDEFALVLADTTAWGAHSFVQRLNLGLSAGDRPDRLRATAGIAEARRGEPEATLIREADAALIAAKRSHRAVQIYAPDVEAENRSARSLREARHVQTLATSLARAVDAKDSYTRSHSETVAALSSLIAAELQLGPEHIGHVRLAGLLHDVGKIGIADSILRKPGPLTDDEYEVMKTHTTLGQEIVAGADLETESIWIRHHHERPDGLGYPDALKGDEIPLESRIIGVADAFEAITSARPYRRGEPALYALRELKRHAGTQFDGACVEALERALVRDAALAATYLTDESAAVGALTA